MQQRGFAEEPGLARAGTTNHQNVFVPSVFRLLRAACHGQPLRHGHGNILKEIRVDEGGNIRGGSPPGTAVFYPMPVLPHILAAGINRQP